MLTYNFWPLLHSKTRGILNFQERNWLIKDMMIYVAFDRYCYTASYKRFSQFDVYQPFLPYFPAHIISVFLSVSIIGIKAIFDYFNIYFYEYNEVECFP